MCDLALRFHFASHLEASRRPFVYKFSLKPKGFFCNANCLSVGSRASGLVRFVIIDKLCSSAERSEAAASIADNYSTQLLSIDDKMSLGIESTRFKTWSLEWNEIASCFRVGRRILPPRVCLVLDDFNRLVCDGWRTWTIVRRLIARDDCVKF